MSNISRRAFVAGSTIAMLGAARPAWSAATSPATAPAEGDVAGGVLAFIRACARPDGSYAASPDPKYAGTSDTAMSDLAGVTYAAVLARTMRWELPRVERSVAFVQDHQRPDGRFVNHAGTTDPADPLAVLYNTTQAAVALRALGARPRRDPTPTMAAFFDDGAFKKLPWYTTSFFPLFYAALGAPFPARRREALAAHLTSNQASDGYIQDHVAATFHAAHFFRLTGAPTPRAAEMVARVLHDQKADGGWDVREPDWDVHACFDALFILRQLAEPHDPRVRNAIARGGRWALRCRHADDGGFGHFPGRPSDMDAVYFNFGSVLQAGLVECPGCDRPDAQTLGWGHAMDPKKRYG